MSKMITEVHEVMTNKDLDAFSRDGDSSFAWIDPAGKIIFLDDGEIHSLYAGDFMNDHDLLVPANLENEKNFEFGEFSENKFLLNLGWIRVSSLSSIKVCSFEKPTVMAWDAWADLIGSVLNNPDRLVYVDYIEPHSTERFKRMTVGEVVDKQCSKKCINRFYKKLSLESRFRSLIRGFILS